MRILLSSLLALTLCFPVLAEMEVYLAPNGGFAPENRTRAIVTEDGRQLSPTLGHAARSLIQGTDPGGQIKIAMYAFSDTYIQRELIEAAFEKDIKVKVLLDGVASWTKEIRQEFIDRVKKAQAKAKEELRDNFQIKVVRAKAFEARGRTRTLRSGKEIYGTMHEKFGVFYEPGMKVPFDCFSGSSNLSYGSDQKFAENRFLFKDDPIIARQYAEEFARLWNEYGSDVLGNAESEIYIPADPVIGGVEVIFNAEPINEESYHKIDQAIMDAIRRVRYKGGTIDIMMFSFTHWQICQLLLEYAQRYPELKIRMLMDQTQLVSDEEHRGILGPYMEEKMKELELKNIEIRYKWRSNIYAWEEVEETEETKKTKKAKEAKKDGDSEGGDVSEAVDPTLDGVPGADKEGGKGEQAAKEKKAKVAQIHWRNLILHHKVIVVDRKIMIAGSYNWSSSAERRNLENVMVFRGKYPGHQEVIDRMMAEFDYLWNNLYQGPPFDKKVTTPQVIGGDKGRKLTKKIISTLQKPNMKPIMEFLDRGNATFSEIVEKTKLPNKVVRKNLEDLVQTGLLFNRSNYYGLAD